VRWKSPKDTVNVVVPERSNDPLDIHLLTGYNTRMKIDYEALDEQFDSLPTHAPVARPTRPVGSLTDNLRQVKPNRDGAHKRMTDMREWAQ